MTARIIALRPVEIQVATDDCVQSLTTAMMSPVFAFAEHLQAGCQAEGMPKWRTVRITVHTSEALTKALLAEDAFDLIIEYDE